MRFKKVADLLLFKDDPLLSFASSSMSCLFVTVETNNFENILQLIEMVNTFRVERKYVLIVKETLNQTLFQNTTINYNLMVEHKDTGNELLSESVQSLKLFTLQTDGNIMTTSICPVLGKKHAQIFNGFCPLRVQNPRGKKLQISFIGQSPYVIYNPTRGSDFLVINMLAEKLKFIPQFIPEKSYDGKMSGLIYQVGKKYFY